MTQNENTLQTVQNFFKKAIKWILLSYLAVFALGFIAGTLFSQNLFAEIVLLIIFVLTVTVFIWYYLRKRIVCEETKGWTKK